MYHLYALHLVPALYDVTLSCRKGTPTLKRMIEREYCAYDVLIRYVGHGVGTAM